MTKWTLAGSTALAALAFGGAAQAQVTPEQVWDEWKTLSASMGQQVTATSETRDGDTLVISGMQILTEDETVRVEGTVDEVSFTDLGDGTVEITMSDSYPLTITTAGVETTASDGTVTPAEPTTVRVEISQPGLSILAGGTEAEKTYDFEAPTLTISLANVEGVDAEALDLTAEATITNLVGSYLVATEDGSRSVGSAMSADSMAMNFAFKDADTQGDMAFTATVEGLEGESGTVLVDGVDMANMAAALAAGFAADGTFSYGATVFDMKFADAAQTFAANGSAETGSVSFAMDAESLAYGGAGTGVTMTVSGSQIPFPELTASYAEAAFDLLMPISKSDVAQDFQLVTRLVGLTVSDALWGIFDPGAVLPRDPATLVIDTSGTAILNHDIMDPAQAEAMAAGAPGTLESLDINAVQLTIGGAELTGNGAFTFDNTDTVTFDGVPAPTGKLDLKLVGGNGLLDKLVQMGLIPDDQAMGARMMLGMFARPGDGVDTLTSTIEFKDKQLIANGQRLQ